jgi:hypothetical protein
VVPVYLGGAVAEVLEVSASGALLSDPFRACFLSLRISAGLNVIGAESLAWLDCKAPGVSEAPGVPGVCVIAAPDGAVAFGPPIAPLPPGDATCAQAFKESRPARDIVAIDVIRLRIVFSRRTFKSAKFRHVEDTLARNPTTI